MEEDKSILKSHIIAEAGLLFRQYGLKSVTMDDIAKHIGISKRTIYQHLNDKEELVNSLLEARLSAHEYELKTNSKAAIDAIHEVVLGLANCNAWLTTFNGKVYYDLQKYFSSAWVKLKDFEERCLSISIKANLKRGIAEELYRKEINVEILTSLRLQQGQFISGLQHDHQQYSTAHLIAEMTEHFLYGVCNVKGARLIEKYKQVTKN
ncbi:TetR/AcrR family transcriptional regulator [Pedobacter insulae]|uniref:DNA-binding transcriptional regulator, AcrR family n=1 Tax=Pedobacter insulae TaxID=414048 RepID=A0A1I2YDE6_9SPHI|nr:TetR/AcrR family transcriptional regulator [Pedobacter insulae]SFH23750.1 DNA-binding transcriptional regulator, AcrR family [Pedobacter insulae]